MDKIKILHEPGNVEELSRNVNHWIKENVGIEIVKIDFKLVTADKYVYKYAFIHYKTKQDGND